MEKGINHLIFINVTCHRENLVIEVVVDPKSSQLICVAFLLND